MRICMLTEYFDPDGAGGVPTMMPQLAQRLRALYPEVSIDVITSRNVYRGDQYVLPADSEQWEGMTVHRLATPRSNQDSIGKRLLAGCYFTACTWAKLMALPKYDVILSATSPPMIPAAVKAISTIKGTPFVYLIHDLFPDVGVALGALPGKHPVTKMAARAQRGWLDAAARVVVIGRCMRDYIVNQYDIPAERISTIPNWADEHYITPRSHETRFRARHGLKGFVLLYAGNYGLYQNFDTVLDAAKHLQQTGRKDITIALVGDGAKREHIEQRIANEHITNVRLFPFVSAEDYPDLLASANAALVTLEPGAEAVGVPSKFYCILASGRPVIAVMAPTSEVARVVNEASCGIRVNQQDTQGLVNAITKLAQSPQLCETMGHNSRQVLENNYTLTHAADRFFHTFCAVTPEEQRANSDNCMRSVHGRIP